MNRSISWSSLYSHIGVNERRGHERLWRHGVDVEGSVKVELEGPLRQTITRDGCFLVMVTTSSAGVPLRLARRACSSESVLAVVVVDWCSYKWDRREG